MKCNDVVDNGDNRVSHAGIPDLWIRYSELFHAIYVRMGCHAQDDDGQRYERICDQSIQGIDAMSCSKSPP